ncbi:alpha/beta hydrolase [Phytohabitans kaempferiae]|uniref:Alpha/beta hydrolase n=1 Tax=Phytohabitans kaempferiae TaxID=1620943 RepID=A0ABV6M148_9ACTN
MEATDPARAALVIPGGMFGPHAPLLMYAAEAARARAASVRPFSWSRPDEPRHLDPSARGPWVLADVTPALDRLAREWPAATPLLIGKSLGSYASVLAADRGLPAVWLTPVLTDPWVVDGLRRMTAPFLLVGGTADRMWDGDLARGLTPHTLEVEGADHGMHVPGRLASSAAVLGQVATAVEDFLDEAVWPSQRPVAR